VLEVQLNPNELVSQSGLGKNSRNKFAVVIAVKDLVQSGSARLGLSTPSRRCHISRHPVPLFHNSH